MWPDSRITQLLNVAHPIIQAPMAGAQDARLAVAVAEAGGLGSLACATLKPDQVNSEVQYFRRRTDKPINLNFFCHTEPERDARREAKWRKHFSRYYKEFDIAPEFPSSVGLFSIDAAMCDLIIQLRPEVVSFHFGLPHKSILDRIKTSGAKILSSATTVREALFLATNGCDAVIAQGVEAGGHRGMFMATDINGQVGTLSLIPQIVDAVGIPVIAAGGIADARGVAAAFMLGASGVQMGTAYLRCDESTIKPVHRELLRSTDADQTALTNVFTGRPGRSITNRLIREIGPMNDAVQEFPLATAALSPIKDKTEGLGDFIPLWAGQSAALGRDGAAGAFTTALAADTQRLLKNLSASTKGGIKNSDRDAQHCGQFGQNLADH
ncbi:MAG: nitronate monooxygenase [Betaproteobacteria bacterium]|nr:nitronate monooxygenase [Betaproteobacteria bacterium]